MSSYYILPVLLVGAVVVLRKIVGQSSSSRKTPLNTTDLFHPKDPASLPRVPLSFLVGVSPGSATVVANEELIAYALEDTTTHPNLPLFVYNTISASLRLAGFPKNVVFLATHSCPASVLEKVTAMLKKHLDLEAFTMNNVPADQLVLTLSASSPVAKPSPPPSKDGKRYRMCYSCKNYITEKKPSQCSACKCIIYCSADCAVKYHFSSIFSFILIYYRNKTGPRTRASVKCSSCALIMSSASNFTTFYLTVCSQSSDLHIY